MGSYVNPRGMTKEAWLAEWGLECKDAPPAWSQIPIPRDINDDKAFLPVVLVDNGAFKACAIGYSEGEYAEFMNPADKRPKRVFVVELGKLKEASDIANWLK